MPAEAEVEAETAEKTEVRQLVEMGYATAAQAPAVAAAAAAAAAASAAAAVAGAADTGAALVVVVAAPTMPAETAETVIVHGSLKSSPILFRAATHSVPWQSWRSRGFDLRWVLEPTLPVAYCADAEGIG